MQTLRPLLFLVAAIAFGLGISLPIVKLDTLYVFSQTPSLIDIVMGLWQDDGKALSLVLVLFSMVLPVLKMSVAFLSISQKKRIPGWAGILSKWSMMDVLLVALVVFAVKTSGIANAVSQPGIWFYGASTLLLAAASLGFTKR